MATFRSIFTYPSNLSTNYIDPDYWSSDATSLPSANDGYWKRINDLRTGTYKASLSGSSWSTSTEDISKFTSMFNDGYYKDANLSSTNLTIYDFWEMPQLVLERELVVNTISEIAYGGYLDIDDDKWKVGIIVTRDPSDTSPAVNAWQMPFGTEFDMGWNINPEGPIENFFTNHLGSTDNGTMRLQTAAGTAGPLNHANYYRFTTSNTTNLTTWTGSAAWLGALGFWGSIIPQRSGSTKSITSAGKVLAYTDTGSDDWYYHIGDTASWSDGDVVNPLEINKIITGASPAIDIAQIGSMGANIYGDVLNGTTIKLYSDSGLTTALDTTTGFDLLDPNLSGWNAASNYSFTATQHNMSASAADMPFNALIGYSATDAGYNPWPPGPEGSVPEDIGEKIKEYAKTFSSDGTTYETPFPILVKATQTGASSLADWSIATAGHRFYAGSYDYDTIAWGRIYTTTVNPIGYSSYVTYQMLIYDEPTAASKGTQTVFNVIGRPGDEWTTTSVDFTFAIPNASTVEALFDGASFTTVPAAPNNVATISTNEPARNRIKSGSDYQSGYGFGNKIYKNRTGASTYANAAVYNNVYYEPGSTAPATTTDETGADISFNQDADGYITGLALGINTEFSHGLYVNDSDMIVVAETSPDTYTPPAATPLEIADTWNTEDRWADYGYADGAKEWPRHVSPMSAEIVYNSPTIVNKSQSGLKYTRSSGHTAWRLDVTYPPMSAEDFKIFAAIAQAGQGQAMPFYFVLRNQDNNPILWDNFQGPSVTEIHPRIKDAITAGDTTMLVEGFNGEESDAFVQGEVFIGGTQPNGSLHTSLSGTDSNIFGEAKIRTTWPFRSAITVGDKVYKNPYHAIVTLASDDFEYQIDVNNYYYVSVSFDLDRFK